MLNNISRVKPIFMSSEIVLKLCINENRNSISNSDMYFTFLISIHEIALSFCLFYVRERKIQFSLLGGMVDQYNRGMAS